MMVHLQHAAAAGGAVVTAVGFGGAAFLAVAGFAGRRLRGEGWDVVCRMWSVEVIVNIVLGGREGRVGGSFRDRDAAIAPVLSRVEGGAGGGEDGDGVAGVG